MPCDTVWPTPNGLPMASTSSPTLDAVGIAQPQMRQIPGLLQLQHRKVAVLIGEHHLGLIFAPVVQHDPDGVGLSHHMIVRHHDPVPGDDHAGAQRVLHPRLAATEIPEELVEERIGGKGLTRCSTTRVA